MTPEIVESPDLERAGPVRIAILIVVAAIALGLASAARMLVFYDRISVLDAVLSGLLDWGCWIPFVPLVFLCRRCLPLVGARPPLRWVAHTVLAFGVSFSQAFVFALLSSILRDTALSIELRSATLVKLHAGAFVYWALLLGLEFLDSQRRVRQEAARRAEVARQLTDARFAALEGHLRPHFLFNTLNSIAAVTRRDPAGAEDMIAKLGRLMRRTVDDESAETSLATEFEFAADYLDIERARFGDRLDVSLDMPTDCAPALVPRLVLQPIVENAVRHGIAPRVEGGVISIGAFREDGQVCVRVTDGGVGDTFAVSEDRDDHHAGFGLAAIRRRLDLLYGARGRLEMRPRPAGGTLVEISIPYHTEAL